MYNICAYDKTFENPLFEEKHETVEECLEAIRPLVRAGKVSIRYVNVYECETCECVWGIR